VRAPSRPELPPDEPTEALPHVFTWERFETFCLAVVRAVPDVGHGERYGKRGSAQLGIDVVAELHERHVRAPEPSLIAARAALPPPPNASPRWYRARP
jgi:hypothetical protein